MIQITFVSNNGKTATAPPNSNLLRVSLREQGGIPFKCGGGLCGTCKCHIDSGLEHTDEVKAKERKLLTEQELASGHRLACQTFVNGDISVSWQPRPPAAAVSRPAPAPARADAAASGGSEETPKESEGSAR
ncbi:2Fe-2S iron-sulfur cluster-binding protein [Cupriavidus gilardii]|uniref:(2Fe-2S)-binding protein n=1 Tax=Cupriavidus gilardii TaxID=82541 RepID=A0A849BB41_9BURK|nr:2Fe-2S iron-sulfur cluster-binding protein [Cupriavidus gilardii]KAB0594886.1 (2Fe-2S)-binding protein [Cupriavidus gilardii]MCT9014227.1 (2Fe-2S)-binding protein [Cupriavidus gilardii]MCT9053947.1 (2Fe-2S)-binding protein [Cupriavidus gilardii]NNH11636.1 (2Fe-2S)-binding protein [Cupriavidus gilardii]WNG68616.1 2Fe-2S iron-sulfur cluster-binding protein [Cupriavidus gilardii]